MQYCYILEHVNYTKNLYGVCIDLVTPYTEGQDVIFSGDNYKAYKCSENFFLSLTPSLTLGDPSGDFLSNPTDPYVITTSSIKLNAVEMLPSTDVANLLPIDYQNYKTDLEGYGFYLHPWYNTGMQNTTFLVNVFNRLFIDNSIPLRAVMYTTAAEEEYICFLSKASDSFTISTEIAHLSDDNILILDVDTTLSTSSFTVGLDTSTYAFGDTEDGYLFRSDTKCPCSRGSWTYNFVSCNEDLYPSKIVCSLVPLVAAIVYLVDHPLRYYTVLPLGLNAALCEEYINQSDIGLTDFKSCPDVGDTEYFEVRNCKTGQETIFGVESGEINPLVEPCGVCPDGFTVSPSGGCIKIETAEATETVERLKLLKGDINAAYGWGGAKIYEITLGRPFPITETDSPYRFTDGIGVEVSLLNTILGIWANTTGINGRLNQIGVKADGANGNYFGFSKCFNIPVEKLYYFGLGADDFCKVRINGVEVIKMELTGDPYSHTHWHLFPIMLSAGNNVIEFMYKNVGGFQSFGAEIYDASKVEIEAWTTMTELDDALIFSTKNFIGSDMDCGYKGWDCPEGYAVDFCANEEIPICKKITKVEKVPCDYPVIRVDQYPCDCFDLIKPTMVTGQFVTKMEEYDDCDDCRENVGSCGFSERTIAYAVMVKLPQPPEPDRGFKECCYDNLVLASVSDDKYSKNDFNSFFFKKQLPSDDCDFILVDTDTASEYALDDNTYGSFWGFGDFASQPDLTVYKLDWRKVLQVLGIGRYKIKKNTVVAGIAFPEFSNTYHLEHYTNELADNSVRIDTVMDGKLVHLDVDFKGTGFTTSLRTKGYFGNRNPDYKQDNLVKRNYDTIQISMSQENEYKFQTGLLPICITEELFDFILFGNILYMNDYNSANHSYEYAKFPVELTGNEGTKYYVGNRDSRINLTFTDREKDKRKLNC